MLCALLRQTNSRKQEQSDFHDALKKLKIDGVVCIDDSGANEILQPVQRDSIFAEHLYAAPMPQAMMTNPYARKYQEQQMA